jgi:hypothetical protein
MVTYTKGIQTDAVEDEAPRQQDEASAAPVVQHSVQEKEEPKAAEPVKPIGRCRLTEPSHLLPSELNENQVSQILGTPDFQSFFDRSSRIVERALNERYDVAVDYTQSEEDKDA